MNAGLTPAEERAEWMIRAFIAEHGYSPTIREMMDAMGYRSPNSIQGLIAGLIDKGRITKTSGARTIQLVDQGERSRLLAKLADLPIGTLRGLVAAAGAASSVNPCGRQFVVR